MTSYPCPTFIYFCFYHDFNYLNELAHITQKVISMRSRHTRIPGTEASNIEKYEKKSKGGGKQKLIVYLIIRLRINCFYFKIVDKLTCHNMQ